MKILISAMLLGLINAFPFERPEREKEIAYPKLYALCPEDQNVFIDDDNQDDDIEQ